MANLDAGDYDAAAPRMTRGDSVYTVIRRYRSTDVLDELVKRKDDNERLIRGVPGFVGYYLIRSDDGGASVTVCEDKRGTDESTRLAAEYIRENLSHISAATPEVTEGETVLSLER